MAQFPRIALALAAASALVTTASAQQSAYDYVSDVAFFERVAVGDVEITPFGIVEESRCLDSEICFKNDDLVISVIVHDERIIEETVMQLGVPIPVFGGDLVLTSAGTPPVRRGAIPLNRYALEFEYIPLP